ncbi:MAG: hypothetical protein K1060chlam2_01020 [Chlamydiae bacterium]|nr:hypothetical protein [Chlamydiota bacterium]
MVSFDTGRIVKRPTYREIDKRLKEAKEALENRRVAFANPDKVVGELMNLEIGQTDEIWELISKLINELHPEDYKGAYPPLKSYESKIENHDLWAFSWYSYQLRQQMYLKFSIKGGLFYYVSLHKCKYSKE